MIKKKSKYLIFSSPSLQVTPPMHIPRKQKTLVTEEYSDQTRPKKIGKKERRKHETQPPQLHTCNNCRRIRREEQMQEQREKKRQWK